MTHPILNVAIQAIRKAGEFIIKQYEFLHRIHATKSYDYTNTVISKIHNESNRIIKTIIKKFYPLHIINTNENNIIINNKKYYTNNIHWIIESIDNNTNFIKQFPFFALSIAVQFNNHIEIGVIYDPIHNELFSACRGKGAQCNGYRIRLNNSVSKNLKNSIIAISYSHVHYNIIINLIHKLNKQYTAINFRYTGSTILDLAYVAIGRVDSCLIITTSSRKINKLASGFLIIQESGGLITDSVGNNVYHHQTSECIIAGHAKIIKILSAALKQN